MIHMSLVCDHLLQLLQPGLFDHQLVGPELQSKCEREEEEEDHPVRKP
jgi:hypothetical protein